MPPPRRAPSTGSAASARVESVASAAVAASVAMTRDFLSICMSSVVFQNFDGRGGAECPCCSYPCNAGYTDQRAATAFGGHGIQNVTMGPAGQDKGENNSCTCPQGGHGGRHSRGLRSRLRTVPRDRGNTDPEGPHGGRAGAKHLRCLRRSALHQRPFQVVLDERRRLSRGRARQREPSFGGKCVRAATATSPRSTRTARRAAIRRSRTSRPPPCPSDTRTQVEAGAKAAGGCFCAGWGAASPPAGSPPYLYLGYTWLDSDFQRRALHGHVAGVRDRHASFGGRYAQRHRRRGPHHPVSARTRGCGATWASRTPRMKSARARATTWSKTPAS
jgi:hypothetical protein